MWPQPSTAFSGEVGVAIGNLILSFETLFSSVQLSHQNAPMTTNRFSLLFHTGGHICPKPSETQSPRTQGVVGKDTHITEAHFIQLQLLTISLLEGLAKHPETPPFNSSLYLLIHCTATGQRQGCKPLKAVQPGSFRQCVTAEKTGEVGHSRRKLTQFRPSLEISIQLLQPSKVHKQFFTQ
jgi:hypothetical protein